MTPLFHELQFYLTRSLSTKEKAELERLIEQNGGIVSTTPARAMQLVNYESLDATHPEWISFDFIKDSVMLQSLQNPSQYSGKVYTISREKNTDTNNNVKKHGRRKYTVEEDARMLHYVKLRGWKSMQPMAESVWRQAEREKVTLHSAQSMYEHFRKQLQRKTLMEQRYIMAKAAAEVRTWIVNHDVVAANEVKRVGEMQSCPNSTGLRNCTTPESIAITQALQIASVAPDQCRSTVPMTSSVAMRGLGNINRRDVRTRSRKPTSPLRISERLRRSEGTDVSKGITSFRSTTSTNPYHVATPVCPATPEISVAQTAPAELETDDQSADRKQHKRKHGSSSSEASVSHDSSLSHQDTEDSDVESVESLTRRDNGVFFRSTWTELARDHTKRRMLQRFFEPFLTPASVAHTSTPDPEAQASSSVAPLLTHPTDVVVPAAAQVGEGLHQVKTMEHATDKETDQIICQLQFDTHQDMPTVVHALYYCSGDVEMAAAFLKGLMPLSMWSPEDDLLLVNLVAEEVIDRSVVDAAIARGDFELMRVWLKKRYQRQHAWDSVIRVTANSCESMHVMSIKRAQPIWNAILKTLKTCSFSRT
ncbi:unnamed protein product [Peronospora belbahrii]|uniref:Telomeric repeat-binding factor 2-interacting protein 1 n=1 Tax=Peronospora belbahrii TaxID=622444 RepID=A0AAU9KXR2_9STRA|nr:unnamed protein product [Peronospora belbahrii]